MKTKPTDKLNPQLANNSPPNSRRWLKLFLKTGSVIGLGLFVLLLVAIGYGQWWAKNNLAPLVSSELTKSLKRPVNVGSVDDVWLDEIRVSNAKIPATSSDRNSIDAPNLVLKFNPFKLLFDRTLKLDVRLLAPSVFVSQTASGSWVNIPPQQKSAPPPVKLEVGSIAIENARVVIVPYSQKPQPINVSKINLQVDLTDRQERANFYGGAQFGDIGQIQLQGNSIVANGETQLEIKGQKLDAAAATRIVKIPEVTIAKGTVDGSLNLAIQPEKYLKISSNLLVNNGKLVINNVPRSLDEINGYIQVSERDVKFNNVTTKYDRVAGVVNGNLNYYTGYQLTAKTAAIALPDVFKSIDVKSPFTLQGAAVAQLALTGKLDRPILTGNFKNSQPSQVDRVQIDRVDGNFRLADGRIAIAANAQPQVGGIVTTQGEVRFLKTTQTRFEVRGERLPGDALVRLYGTKLPPGIQIDNATVNGTIGGSGNDIVTNLRVEAPQATYPLTVDLQVTPQGQTLVRSATLALAGSKIQATGDLNATDWRLNLQLPAVDTQKLAQLRGLTLPTNYHGKLSGDLQLAGLNNDPNRDRFQATGRLNLQLPAGQILADRIQIDRGKWQAQVSSNALDLQQLQPSGLERENSPQATLGTPRIGSKNNAVKPLQLPAGKVSGIFNVSGNSLTEINANTINAQGRGNIQFKTGEVRSDNLTIANGNWQGLFTSKNLQLAEFTDRVNGKLNGSFNLAGNLQQASPASIRGTGAGTIDLPEGKIVGNNLQIDRGKWQGNIRAAALNIRSLAPQIPLPYKQAKLDADLQVAGDLKQPQIAAISARGTGKLSFADGNIRADRLEITAGKWSGNFATDRLQLGNLTAQIPSEFSAARLTGNFTAAGELTNTNPARLQLAGNGEIGLADSKIRARNFKLERGNLSSELAIANLRLGSVSRQLPAQFQTAKLTGNFNFVGDLDRLTPAAIQANGSGKLKLATGGEITATDFQTAAGDWRSDLAVSSLNLGAVNRQLPRSLQAGLLSGNFRAAGNLNEPDLERIQASGNAQINNLLGGKILVNDIAVDNGKWQTNIVANRVNIAELTKFAPQKTIDTIGGNAPIQNRLGGQITGNWQIGGNLQNNSLANLQVSGQTQLTNFKIGSFAFDRNLAGNVRANPGEGVDINFTGQTDRIALTLDRNLQPQSFDVKQRDVTAKGNIEGKLLAVNVERLPISLLQRWIPKNAGIKPYRLGGIATGNLTIDLAKTNVAGKQIEITNPIFGAFEGERMLTNFNYADGRLSLNQEIQRGRHTYIIDANVTPGSATPTFQAKFQVPSGNIEDVRNLLQIFSLNDVFTPFPQRKYGTAADLIIKNEPLANRPQPLYNELRRLSELRRWLNSQADRQAEIETIPDIGTLQGDFSGEIAIANNPKTGLNSDFKVVGTNWQLERYNLDRIQATGNWRNGKLQLEPLNLTIDNSQINIAGDFGLNNQNAKVTVADFPVEALTSLVYVPVDINGRINMTAEIGGNLANPRMSGEVSIANGQLNTAKLNDAKASFNYWDGRLNFISDATFADRPMVAIEDRIKINGSIPYQLPFALKAPASRDIRIDLSLQNQGLQILDVFSKQQLQWLDGQGKIALKIDGKMKPTNDGIESLTASGTASVSKGRIQSAAIPEPITDVNGEIVFDFDRIDVQKLSGKFKRGSVDLNGIIPISESFAIDPSKRLSAQMNGIAVNLPEKYQGDVNGKLTILGTALNPGLTGDIKLSNGQVFLPDTSSKTTTTVLGIQPAIPDEPNPNALQLRNLKLTLGENLQITRAPILSFIATGKLDLDGTIDNPRPFGEVQLQKGSVNLFTTQFRLASGPQTANFFPTLGADPVLNLRLAAKILESTSSGLSQRNTLTRTSNGEIDRPAEFYTTSLGSVQTVQVEARIAGLASQLTQRLELSSSPARSQPEILLLLGGGLVERLSSGDNIGLGVVSLAGSTLLTSLQDRISDVLSLSDFRLFPTILKDSKTSSNSTLGIAAEVGTEITPRVSASVFKILTNSESPFYSLRYRVNDQILLRGSTNLFGENRALVEFEQRF